MKSGIQNILCEAAKTGDYSKVPGLCEAHLCITINGTSIAHIAAKNETLGKIPKELLTPKVLSQKNSKGLTPIDIQKKLASPDIRRVKELLTKLNKNELRQEYLQPKDIWLDAGNKVPLAAFIVSKSKKGELSNFPDVPRMADLLKLLGPKFKKSAVFGLA